MKNRLYHLEQGFSMIDLVVVITLIGIISAIALPSMTSAIEQMKLGQSAREVERELQTAKMRAVGKGRVMRVRFNCPTAGQYRITELIGTPDAPAPADSAADRCSEATYPYPAGDANPTTRPNLDGPVRRLDSSVTFAVSETIEFWTDGTARRDTGAGGVWPLIPVAGVNITLAKGNATSTITVNGLGKIQLQQQQ
jgi:type II secretory pathway pseudopilin PulG